MKLKLSEKGLEESQEYFLSQSQMTENFQTQKQSSQHLNDNNLENCFFVYSFNLIN